MDRLVCSKKIDKLTKGVVYDIDYRTYPYDVFDTNGKWISSISGIELNTSFITIDKHREKQLNKLLNE